MQEESIRVEVTGRIDAEDLRAMLASSDLHFTEAGRMVKKFTISGTPQAIAAFLPKLLAWQLDCESRDAW